MAWLLDPLLVDSYVLGVAELARDERLRTLKPILLAPSKVEVYSSQFARAYRVRDGDGRELCLRLWLDGTSLESVIEIYAALDDEGLRPRVPGLPNTRLIHHAFEFGGDVVPAVLMDWVKGEHLGDWLSRNRSKPTQTLRMLSTLRKSFVSWNDAGVSHGDLRASNIVVRSGGHGISVAFIDLDSLRWWSGPPAPRILGGNPLSEELRMQHQVGLLEQDHLDQAMTLLVIAATAGKPQLWRGSTDDYLWLDRLGKDPDSLLRHLGNIRGFVGSVALAVRRVFQDRGCWSELAPALAGRTVSLSEDIFWVRAGLRGRPLDAVGPAPVANDEVMSAPSRHGDSVGNEPVSGGSEGLRRGDESGCHSGTNGNSNPITISSDSSEIALSSRRKAFRWALIVALFACIMVFGLWLFS